jgi:hypothetical protein
MSTTPDTPAVPVPERHNPVDLGRAVPADPIAAASTPTLDVPAAGLQPADAERPNGPFAAGMLAAGTACTVFGLSVIAVEASTAVEKAMTLSQPVGSLSGKAVTATVAFALAWLVLHLTLRHRRPDLGRVMWITAALTVIGLLGTFPPFYTFISGH